MTIDETINKLNQMKLHDLAKSVRDMLETPADSQLSFEERLALLVDTEWTQRENRRIDRRLKQSRVSARALPEELVCDPARGIDRAVFRDLTTGGWIKSHLNVVILGPTGTGKSFVASTLVHAACRHGFRALFVRTPRLLEQLSIARAAAQYSVTLQQFAKLDLLVLDDFLLHPLTELERRDVLEVLEDRYGKSSTIITSQVPTKSWHEAIGDPTIADAICDRLVHNAHVLQLRGSSIRRQKALKPTRDPQPTD
jgi:DNA replication protein DnaC